MTLSERILAFRFVEVTRGLVGFFRNPVIYRLGGPFNNQRYRQLIFFELLYHLPLEAIIETGTYRGTTTALFAATSLPVFSSEINPRFYYYAKLRLLLTKNEVTIHNSDSRAFLCNLSKERHLTNRTVFFYLDAHWGEDLPLHEELQTIFDNWQAPVVMIDDFCVPDSQYRFDDYGPGKGLTMNYLAPIMKQHNLALFFPAVSAHEETGAKRGCCLLCRESMAVEIDSKIRTLIRFAAFSRPAPFADACSSVRNHHD
jgi:hypothetical protein